MSDGLLRSASTAVRFRVNAEGGIPENVCQEIVDCIRVVQDFPKPVCDRAPPATRRACTPPRWGAQTPAVCTPRPAPRAPRMLPLRGYPGRAYIVCGLRALPCDCAAQQGLQFKDLSLLLANPKAFGGVIDALVAKYSKRNITAVVGIGLCCLPAAPPCAVTRSSRRSGILTLCARCVRVLVSECRGFCFAAPVAIALKVPFIPLRKPGKLPSKSIGVDFKQSAGKGAAYFGKDRLEMHEDGLLPGSRVLVIDDMLGTGSTMYGACELVRCRPCCITYTYTDTYTYTCSHAYRHARLECVRMCVCVCVCVCVRACVHECRWHMCLHICVHTCYVCTVFHIHTYTHQRIHICKL